MISHTGEVLADRRDRVDDNLRFRERRVVGPRPLDIVPGQLVPTWNRSTSAFDPSTLYDWIRANALDHAEVRSVFDRETRPMSAWLLPSDEVQDDRSPAP